MKISKTATTFVNTFTWRIFSTGVETFLLEYVTYYGDQIEC